MRQTSEEFMKAMEEFNEGTTPKTPMEMSEKLAEEIDSRIDKAIAAAMSKYQAEVSKVSEPIPAKTLVEAPEEQSQEGVDSDDSE